jgi:NTP pyrophosphatase (non-canonical NTP hydrolase)
MDSIEKDVLEWHRETFPRATLDAIQDKLQEELKEFIEVVKGKEKYKPVDYWDELADVIIVNMVYVNRSSNGEVTLEDIVRRKLEINKERTWGSELPDGSRPRVKTS